MLIQQQHICIRYLHRATHTLGMELSLKIYIFILENMSCGGGAKGT